MSKKRKAGNADEDAMALASSYSREELEQMLADETEALGGMVEDDLLTQAKLTRRMTTSERQMPPRLP